MFELPAGNFNRDLRRRPAAPIGWIPLLARKPTHNINTVMALGVPHVSLDKLSPHRVIQVWIPTTLDFNDDSNLLQDLRIGGGNRDVYVHVGSFALCSAQRSAYLHFTIDDNATIAEVPIKMSFDV